MIPMTAQDRERFVFALVIGLVLNVALYLGIEILVRLDAARAPREFAELQVELELEEPAPDRVEEPEPPKAAELPPAPAPAPQAPAPAPQAQPELAAAPPVPAPRPVPQKAAPPKAPPPEPPKEEPPVEEPIKDEFRIPSGPVAGAAQPAKPSTPTFRTEGARPAASPAPPSPQATPAQPFTVPAPAEDAPAPPQGPSRKVVPGQAQSTTGSGAGTLLPLDELDRRLGSAAPAEGPPVPEGQSVSGGGRAPSVGRPGPVAPSGPLGPGGSGGDQPFQIEFADPAKGRTAISTPLTDPPMQAKQGQRLRVVVQFTLTPQGFLTGVNYTPAGSSGIPQVDAWARDTVRRWRFQAVNSKENVLGAVTFFIEPK